ncbi:hypothetical protein MHU86_16157 [Fragilaria crotonensis]|nr:hypothetical protein MHU86_16157 [Fragilaria crotonensis]
MEEAPPFTVVDALIACGVDNVALFMGQTQAIRIADDVFNGSFLSCLDITFKELDEAFKAYSELSVAQGQIRVPTGTRKNVKAFLQWTRDEICLARDPSHTPFPVNKVLDLIRRYKTHEQFQTNSKMLAEAAKPEKFKDATKWEDWKPTFLNYLRSIPGRNGIPLKYICREADAPDLTAANADFPTIMSPWRLSRGLVCH